MTTITRSPIDPVKPKPSPLGRSAQHTARYLDQLREVRARQIAQERGVLQQHIDEAQNPYTEQFRIIQRYLRSTTEKVVETELASEGVPKDRIDQYIERCREEWKNHSVAECRMEGERSFENAKRSLERCTANWSQYYKMFPKPADEPWVSICQSVCIAVNNFFRVLSPTVESFAVSDQVMQGISQGVTKIDQGLVNKGTRDRAQNRDIELKALPKLAALTREKKTEKIEKNESLLKNAA